MQGKRVLKLNNTKLWLIRMSNNGRFYFLENNENAIFNKKDRYTHKTNANILTMHLFHF